MPPLRPNTTTRSNPLPMDEEQEAVIAIIYTSPDGGTSWEPATNPSGATDGLTNAELRAAPVEVTGDFASDGLTDAELRASPVPVSVSGTVTANLGTIDGAATETTLAALLTELGTKLDENGTVSLSAASLAALENITVTVGAALPAGNNNIGDVDIASALPAGTNNIGDVDVLTLPAIPAGNNNIGDVDVASVPAPLNVVGGGTEAAALRVTIANNSSGVLAVDTEMQAASALADTFTNPSTGRVGSLAHVFNGTTWDRARGDITNGLDVDVTRLPTLPAGTNNIGDVDVLTLPALPAGTNNIGDVDVLTLPSIPAGTNNIGDVDVLTLPALPAGNNNIGDVDVVTLPALPAGNNNIGDVDVLTLPNVVESRPATATLTNVAASATSVQLLASTAGRRGFKLWNDSTSILYVKYGTTASTTSCTVKIPPDAYYEDPAPCYTGRVDGIWASAVGNARITELT